VTSAIRCSAEFDNSAKGDASAFNAGNPKHLQSFYVSYTVEVATAASARRFQTISLHPPFWLTSALKDEACMVEAIVFWNEPTKLSYWNFQLRKG
jgi:hypothetical protein